MAGFRTSLLASVLCLLCACATADGPSANAQADESRSATGRDAYDPEIGKDAYVIEQWARTAETLQRACAETGEHCEEAKAARDFLDAQ